MSSRDNFRQAARELFGLESKKNKDGDAPPSVEGFLSELPVDETEPQTEPQTEHGQSFPPAAEAAPVAPSHAASAPQQNHGGAAAVAHGYSAHGGYASYQPETAEPAAPYEPQSYIPPVQQQAPQQGYVQPDAQRDAPVYSQRPAHPVVQQNNDYAIVDTRRETSIIAKGTTIVGRVRTDGHIEVMGRVEGNIDAEGNVAVSGRVSGNVKGQHLELLSCQIKGDLHAGAGIFVNGETVIIGDIAAENVIFDGRIKGNIEAAQSAEFNRNSYIVGDISAKTIAIEPGAVINGMVRTLSDQVDDNDFEEF